MTSDQDLNTISSILLHKPCQTDTGESYKLMLVISIVLLKVTQLTYHHYPKYPH